MPIYRLNTKIRLIMLCLSGFELYSYCLGAPAQSHFVYIIAEIVANLDLRS